MRRRELLLMATSIIAARAVRAEQKPMPVIGFLGTSPQNAGFLDPFRQGLSEIGYFARETMSRWNTAWRIFTMISSLPWSPN